MPVGDEHRVVAETLIATGRPGQAAVDLAAKHLGAAVGPGEGEDGDEMGGGVLVAERLPHPFHREVEIPLRPGPARRIDAGVAAQRRHDEPRIVAERDEAARVRAGLGLQRGIGLERVAGLVGLGEAELGGAHRRDAQRREQRRDLAHLALIVAGDQQPLDHRPSAVRCWRASSAMPARASSIMRANSSSPNGAPSAVAWISTMPPVPVMTKFASVSAFESSA